MRRSGWGGRVAVCLAASVAGCASGMRAATEGEPVTVRNAEGRTIGTALLLPRRDGVQVVLQVSGLSPGPHGVHIHAHGRCETPDFQSAGGHFDPRGREHGFQNPRGPHAGDLPNLDVQADGRGVLNAVARGVVLRGAGDDALRRPGGTALVIHAAADDDRTDPSGNSGARIACGIIPEAE
jgi:superoxide dismutase, Cu-Zn family